MDNQPEIKALKEKIEVLEDELDRLKNVIYNLPGNIYWKNTQGVYLGRNHYAAELMYKCGFETELNVDAVIGKTDFELFDEKTAQLYRDSDEKVMDTKKIETREETLSLPDNSVIHHLSMKRPLFNPKGKLIGILGNSVDMSAQKKAEELRLQNTVIEEKTETMRLLASSIAHELRTPLASIKALGETVHTSLPKLLEAYEIALQAGKVDQPLRKLQLETLKNLPEELNHITSSTNIFIDMLLAKVNLENMKEKNFTLTRLSIKEALMEALLHYPFDEHSISLIECNYSKPFTFKGDKILFQHIIFNLLKNAIYHVRASGHAGKITLWFEQRRDKNTLHFKDTGTGISAENLPHIFTSFYSRTRHGTGIGLAFCKLIMENFDGKIHCDSVEGEYTHFMLDFPKMELTKK